MTSTKLIYFLTGNSGKVKEIRTVLPRVEQLKIDLPEIQSLDPREIIRAKVEAAFAHHEGPFIVEDTSLQIDGMNGLPGPFVRWFELALDHQDFVKMAEAVGDGSIVATTWIGYAESRETISYYVGSLAGQLVSPRGDTGFGWDPIFLPDGYKQTLAEMGPEQKTAISYRGAAIRKLAEALQ